MTRNSGFISTDLTKMFGICVIFNRNYLLICTLVIGIAFALATYVTFFWMQSNEVQDGWTDSLRYKKIHHDTNNTDELRDLTIVTMYISIGSFKKGGSKSYSPELYRQWMKVFASLQNPVVAFFDKEDDKVYFENLRRRLGAERTKVILLKRSQLWAFSLLGSIKKIFSKPNYPKHHPNTVVPEYSCVMHAKYEIMSMAIKKDFFHTRYFAWVDIGLFRSLAAKGDLSFFELWLPPNFNVSTVAYTEVYNRMPSLKPKAIVYNNAVWVGGGMFIGEASIMTKWCQEYIRATETIIKNFDLMSTDQQVLYINQNWGQPTVGIQTYRNPDKKRVDWSYLGYLCKEQGYKRSHGLI